MKTTTTKNLFVRSSMALAVMVTIHIPASSWSAESAEGKEMKTDGKEMKMEGKMMEKCEEMKKEKQKMQAEMKAQDAELTAAIATMNSAAQDKKLDLVAGVVTRLVEQRTAMNEKKAKMQEKMMKHMMAHMQTNKESISKCPMMKDKGMDDTSAGGHKVHQQEPK